MATIPGAFLLAASSPYSRRGELWRAYRQHHGNEASSVLCWQAPTRTMNPTVPQRIIDEALEEDPSKAGAEYLAEFRSDIETFVSREVVEAAVVNGRYELPYTQGVQYKAFCDPSGAAADSMSLALGHVEGEYGVLDVVRERRPPFSPESVVEEFSELLKSYKVNRVVGDRWGGEWVVEAFASRGITYVTSERPKSAIYNEFLPKLNSGKIELLDLPRLVSQLCALERRTGRGSGKDSIDHPPGGHDDVANSVAGVMVELLAGLTGHLVVTDEMLQKAREYRPGKYYGERYGQRTGVFF